MCNNQSQGLWAAYKISVFLHCSHLNEQVDKAKESKSCQAGREGISCRVGIRVGMTGFHWQMAFPAIRFAS